MQRAFFVLVHSKQPMQQLKLGNKHLKLLRYCNKKKQS